MSCLILKILRFAFVLSGAAVVCGAPVTAAGLGAQQKEAAAPTDDYADVRAFVLSIKGPTISLKVDGDGFPEKLVTIGRNDKGEVVVTSLQVMLGRAYTEAKIPPGTVAILRTHPLQIPQPPFAFDDYYLRMRGIRTFVSSEEGKHLFEVASEGGSEQVRLIRSPTDFGAWEAYQTNPQKYHLYNERDYPPPASSTNLEATLESLNGAAEADAFAGDVEAARGLEAVSLIRAKLIKAKDVTDYKAIEAEMAKNPNVLYVDAEVLRSYRPTATLAGAPVKEVIEGRFWSAMPIVGEDYYLVVGRKAGALQIVWQSPASDGLCLGDREQEIYHLAGAVSALAEKYPCKE